MNNKLPSKVLVTGGAGYIGSHACKALASQGFEPVVYDNLSRGHREFVKWGPLEEGDLRDSQRLTKVLKEYEPCAVLHFAAFAYVGESTENPLMYYDNNVGGTLSLLKCMRETGTRNLVFSSSCATYGIPESIPITEDTPQKPINPYGMTKLMCERMIRDLDNAGGLPHVILRYFNAAGADPDGELRENHDPESHIIPRAIRAAQGKLQALQIFGNDYDTHDGTCIRDYIHVTDLAKAHVLSVKRLIDKNKSDCYNLGIGKGFSVKEVVDSVSSATGSQVPFDYAARREGDPAKLVADNSKARTQLEWKPKVTELDVIVRDAVGKRS